MLHCPFCGHKPDMDDTNTIYPNGTGWLIHPTGIRVYVSFRDVPAEQWCYSMHCVTTSGGCGAEISGDSYEETIAAWQRRPDTRVGGW